jgi:CRISPR-associated protein Cmr6
MTRGFEIGTHAGAGGWKEVHPGLALGSVAPIDPRTGKIPDETRSEWLAAMSETAVSPDYKAWYEGRWKQGLGRALMGTVEATTRLLVGAGEASAVDVGLRVHHTWGVPCIPGSSLKGLLSHWLDVVYGPSAAHDGRSPWDPGHPEAVRAPFRRTLPTGMKPQGPGEIQRILFGSPEVEGDLEALHAKGLVNPRSSTTACRGRIVIHDALFVPGSSNDNPFLADVLTVHHASWYQGKGPANDHESPTPVGFLSVRPGVQLLLAVGLAPGEAPETEPWVDFAFTMLLEALADWGIGSKTAAGYGRLEKRIEAKRSGKVADDYREQLNEWLTNHLSDLKAIVNTADGPAAFVAMLAEHHGSAIRSVKGEIRKQRLQVVSSFLSKELQASQSKRKTIGKLLEEAFPLD